jgi:hypothetical protein
MHIIFIQIESVMHPYINLYEGSYEQGKAVSIFNLSLELATSLSPLTTNVIVRFF